MPPWRLDEACYAEIKEADYEVAVLPFGATEPHNLHLPYGTDTLEADLFGQRACERAAAGGAKVILLPTIPFGTETNQREFPLSLNLNPSTLHAIITDLVDSLIQSGIRKIVLLNSHGGNDFKPLLRELYGTRDCHLFLCFWPQLLADVYEEVFEADDNHAGEAETSLILATAPELVRRGADGQLTADSGAQAPTRFHAINQGWVSITRPWHLLTTNTGAGNPHAATAAKGERAIEVVTQRLSDFLCELSAAEIDERFPY